MTISNAANATVRELLTREGVAYDRARGLAPQPVKLDLATIAWFGDACAYCGGAWSEGDHATPINRTHAGLHAVGNLVPSCRPCNMSKAAHDRRGVEGWRAICAPALLPHLIAFRAGYTPDVEAIRARADALYCAARDALKKLLIEA